MTDVAEPVASETDYLSMSDEEMMNASAPVEQTVTEAVEVESPDTEEESSEPDSEDAGDTDADAGVDEPAQSSDNEGGDKPTEVVTDEPKNEKTEEPKTPSVDYESEYKRLLAPFKANGHEIQVNTVEDAISLMQMGANYNKKMAALKPNLKLMKQLENNGLMSEEKIGFLIDLVKKDPAAINKLVKESGIDPMELDADKAKDYRQSTYAVDDREIELDTVFDEIQDTPTYTRTLDIVSNKWDHASKDVISGSPQLLKVINDHVQSGVYDLISKGVESERMFGRLNGLSDIQAYRQVGDSLQAAGKFNHLGHQGNTKPAPVVVVPAPSKVEDDKLKDKRRAASSTKPAGPATTSKEYDPLNMSDAEFSKLVNKKFL